MSSEETTLPMAANENVEPAESSASVTKAHGVPSRDRRLVLSAIDGQLNAAKAAWREKHGDKAGRGKEEFFMGCIDQTGASLKRQLEAATVPVDEAEGALDAYQTELLAARPLATPTTDRESDDESLSSVDEEGDISFDDNEILDQEAYDQAKQLRSRAREIAARVISVREEAAGRALELTRRDLSELLKVHGFSENEEEAQDDGERAEDAAVGRDSSSSMQMALQTLASSLQNVDSGLADKLESLKETIGTIDSSVEKYQRASQGDESALSQTEKALLASETPRETMASVAEEDEDTTLDPDKNLARLLAGVL